VEPTGRSTKRLAHGAGDLAAHDDQVLTKVVPAGNAVATGPTNKVGFEHHPSPWFQVEHLRANLVDNPDNLVPGNVRKFYKWVVTGQPV
jgi:hypothetical protein